MLGAAYMLIYRRVIFGKLVKNDLMKIRRESRSGGLRAADCFGFWMGIYPVSFLDVVHVSVEFLLHVDTALEAAGVKTAVAR